MKLSINRAVALLLAGYVGLLWFSAAPLGHIHTGDTDNLIAGSRAALDCIHLGQWIGCGHLDGSIQTEVFPYPLLQYLPAAALVKAGATDIQGPELLARLNIVAFASSFGLMYLALRRRQGMWPIACAALVGSALTYQATSGFGEMLAAAAVLGALASARSRKWWLIVPAFALACIAKETLFPFLLAVGLIAGRDDDDGLVPCRARLIPMVVGTVAGFGLSLAFNIFRFGTPRNLLYLDPVQRTPGLGRKAEFLGAQWFAPSSGIGWYWPLATVLFVVCAATAVARLRRQRPPHEWLPALAVAALVLAYTTSLSLWFTPFGWITYGPRLAAPLLPALIVLALTALGPLPQAPLIRRRLGHSAAVLAAIALLALAAWPQMGAPWTYGDSLQALIAEDDACPNMTQYSVQEDPEYYFDCSQHVMWRVRPSTLGEAASLHGTPSTVARVIGIAVTALAAMQLSSRHRMRAEPSKDAA